MRVISKKDKFKPEKLSAQEASLAKKKTMLTMYEQDLENPVLVRYSQTVIYRGGGVHSTVCLRYRAVDLLSRMCAGNDLQIDGRRWRWEDRLQGVFGCGWNELK